MVRRLIVLSAAAFLFMLLALPGSALAAKTWTVKNNGGDVVGKVHRLAGAPGYFDVDDANGTLIGGLEANGLVMTPDGGVHGRAVRRSAVRAILHKTMSPQSRIVGTAVLSNGRWIVKKLSDGKWHRRGTIQAACPGKAAACALRILLW